MHMATVSTQKSGEKLLTPAEVAALFRVDPKTVTRWAKAGKLSSIRTLGLPVGGEGRNRTADTAVFSRVLCQLSYLAHARGDRIRHISTESGSSSGPEGI
jgi:hypothetical protein